jgi:prevent-host-death family protein
VSRDGAFTSRRVTGEGLFRSLKRVPDDLSFVKLIACRRPCVSIVGLTDAKSQFYALVERVGQGEEFTITKRGVAVAVLVAPANRRKKDPMKVAERIRALRRGARLKGVTIRQLIEGGRRY